MGIQEIGAHEIDEVNGGIPLVVALVVALYGTEIAYGAGVVAGAGIVLWATFDD
jgi:hypothetical protein